MKQGITMLIGAFLTINSALSQSDFRDGYIIDGHNDTIYGLIDYRGNKSNAKKCIFIKSGDASNEKDEYTPSDIKAYRFIDSKYYVSKKIKIEGKDELLFLEYLINGIVSIYYYRNNFGGEHYLIEKENGKLIELQNDKIVLYIEDHEYTRESREYIGILSFLFQDAPGVKKEAEKAVLNHNSLIKIGKDYHNAVCKNETCIVYEKEIPRVSLDFGPLLGISYNSQYMLDDFYLDENNPISISPLLGLFIKLGLPLINERVFFQFNFSYSRPEFTTEKSTAYFLNYYSSLAITLNSLNNNGMIRYEFPKGKLRPVLECGGFYNYIFKTSYSHELDVKWGTNEKHYSFSGNPIENYDYGISIGLGCIYPIFKDKDIYLDLKYQRGFAISKDNTSFSIGIPF